MDLDKAIKERHSVRRFTSKKPDWKDIIEAIEAAGHAPLAGNISTLRFLVVSDKDKIQELADAAQQDFIATSSYVIVICSDLAQCHRSYGERAKKYATQQAGAAIENMLLKLTELGLATCWVGAFSDETVKRILQIPEEVEVEAFFPIGHEFGRSKQRLKPNLDAILYFNVWKNKYMTRIRKVEAV